MRAAKIVEREINLRAVDVNVGVVGEGQANAVVEGENELAVGDVILESLGRGQRRGRSLTAIEAKRCIQWRSGLRARRSNAEENK